MEHRETPAALERFGAQLAHEIGEAVSVEVVPSYAALEAALAAGEAQLAWLPPILLADGDENRLVPLVTSLRGGASEYCAVLFVRADSDLFTLKELRGSTVAWVDQCSAAGYLLPRLHLIAEGLRLETLFRHERFLGSHDAVVRAVFDGSADVGATFGGPPGSSDADERSGFADVEPKQPVRVIFRSGPVPADAVVCDTTLPTATRVRVTAALLHLGTFAVGRRVTRRLFGADGFATFDPHALALLRGLVTGARARGWLPWAAP
ncbi:MAG: methyl-accepting chemotaxis protein [bacterium]|nr:methyl-accepting chemotaxis protein [bacterium]